MRVYSELGGAESQSKWVKYLQGRSKMFWGATTLITSLIVIVILLFSFLLYDLFANHDSPDGSPKNLIFMISDGCGPASMTLARELAGKPLPLDSILTGTVRTVPDDPDYIITDSAAGATAYACGQKSYNKAIAVDADHKCLGTMMEAAVDKGLKTGIVVTCIVNHATPGAFTSHAVSRNMYDFIAEQQITKGLDVIFGGGLQYFLPEYRSDGRDLIKEAEETYGYTVVLNVSAFRAYSGKGPLLALFAMHDMDFEIDRNNEEQPSLAEMTQKALEIVSKSSSGFMLMVEGSRIDHAGHLNDIGAHYHDIIAYNEAVQEVIHFVDDNEGSLLVSVSDHETGGVTLGSNVDIWNSTPYTWHKDVILGVSTSCGVMAQEIQERSNSTNGNLTEIAVQVLLEYASITPFPFELEWIEELSPNEIVLGRIIASHANIGWTTFGHTAVDVNLYSYASGLSTKKFEGHYENSKVGKTVIQMFDFDVDKITQDLKDFDPTDGGNTKRGSDKYH